MIAAISMVSARLTKPATGWLAMISERSWSAWPMVGPQGWTPSRPASSGSKRV